MKKIRRLALLTKEYPSPGDPIYPFVEALACEFADAGVELTVIAPMDLSKRALGRRGPLPETSTQTTAGGASFTVRRPRYVSMTNRGCLAYATYRNFRVAAARALQSLPTAPDALYGHFISMAGLAAAELGDARQIPSFLAYGESSLALCRHFSADFLRARLRRLRGVVAVSTKNRDELLGAGLYDAPERVRVFPNAVDAAQFGPGDRAAARRLLNLPEDAFLVAFCGSFIERKGVLRLCRALDQVDGASGLFIGRGEQTPDCRQIAFCGSVAHQDVPAYLQAADVFALPTLAEGCCNAVVEALACGLPVVSSDRSFNLDVLDDSNALLIDPTDVSALASAIARLKAEPALRERLARGALARAEALTLPARARAILSFMEALC